MFSPNHGVGLCLIIQVFILSQIFSKTINFHMKADRAVGMTVSEGYLRAVYIKKIISLPFYKRVSLGKFPYSEILS